MVWATLGIPGNIVTLYLFNDTSPNPTQPELPIVENNTEFTCHEVKAEWQEYVALSKLYIQGIYNVFFGIFNKLLSTQNVNLARFARNVECDFLL